MNCIEITTISARKQFQSKLVGEYLNHVSRMSVQEWWTTIETTKNSSVDTRYKRHRGTEAKWYGQIRIRIWVRIRIRIRLSKAIACNKWLVELKLTTIAIARWMQLVENRDNSDYFQIKVSNRSFYLIKLSINERILDFAKSFSLKER